MTNSNIYDIDDKLVFDVNNPHKLTVEEAKNRIEEYKNALNELDENDKKASIYTTYIRNLTAYILTQYSKMSGEELMAEMDKEKAKTTDEKVKQAIDELKKEIESEEQQPLEESTEQPNEPEQLERPEIVMDEYTTYEEVE